MFGISKGWPVLLLTNYPKHHHHSAIDFQLIPNRRYIVVIVVVYEYEHEYEYITMNMNGVWTQKSRNPNCRRLDELRFEISEPPHSTEVAQLISSQVNKSC